MKISIVTISYNQGQFLEKTILSVIRQNYQDLEYIVVDPGSTDGSREIIEKYRDHIAHIIFEPDEGPADGLNKGFQQATGEIWGYINADDMLGTQACKKVNDFFMVHPNIDVVSGHGYVVDENDKVLHKIFSHQFDLKSYAMHCCVLVQQSTFFRPQLFNQVGGFNKTNPVCWDGELMVDYALYGAKFAIVHDYWSYFRVYPDSITTSSYLDQVKQEEHERIMNKIGIQTVGIWDYRRQWILTRIQQPLTSCLRIIDGIKNPQRAIPKKQINYDVLFK